jgi:hypothetical protein
MYQSPTRKAALAAYDQFIASYQAKYPKATEYLEKAKNDNSLFMTFQPSTGPICEPPTRSNPPLLPCAFVRSEPKGVVRG